MAVRRSFCNTIGGRNTAMGYGALSSSTSGTFNTALGWYAGWSVTDAFNVICIGSIGENVSNSTWIGSVYGITHPKRHYGASRCVR